MKTLDKINFPSDLKNLSLMELQKLPDEIRSFLIETISKTGGHLGSNLGVVELTLALHYVFEAPRDKIIWDIGHQAYVHKILTGRREKMHTIRQKDGISGFCSIFESEYDAFGAGHSSTSISAGLGMAISRDLNGENHNVISIIGDSSMTAGMAYEGINNAGHLGTKMIVILNDNDMSISKPVGALRNYLVGLISSNSYIKLRNVTKKITKKMHFPNMILKLMKRSEIAMKEIAMGNNIFEALGFYYIGPIDGHDLQDLIHILEKIKDLNIAKPILLHVKTEKGRGYKPAIEAKDKLHGVSKFDIETGEQIKSSKTTYTDIFSQTLQFLAEKDDKIVGITAAMPSGTGLNKFAEKFPNRMFDVGIAEQHAVTFAGGMAISGHKPYCCIYSTFLQRSYDQIIHDIAIQSFPVRFIIDRAGDVGADGATHHGFYDLSMLLPIPDIILMSPSSGQELISMLKTANEINDRPCAIRYGKKAIPEDENLDISSIEPMEIGKMLEVRCDENAEIAVIFYGDVREKLQNLLENDLKDKKISIYDARFAKPLDEKKLLEIKKSVKKTIIIEDTPHKPFESAVRELIG